MKKNIFALFSLALLAWFISGCSPGYYSQDNTASQDNQSSNYAQDNNPDYPEYNVDDLNQYGGWVNVNPYGRVWQPNVVGDWQPFTNGHWAYDGNDWVWVSYEPFGWIVYHYGYWENTPDYGWLWIPGRDAWSPARVQWLDYGDNICWAPLRPNNNYWPEPWENNRIHPWMVVRMEDFNRENITTYRVSNVSRVDNDNRTPIVRRAPDVKTVQRYVKEPISVVKIQREPVQNQTPPVRTINPPVRNNNPPIKTNPPVRNDNPPVRTNPPVRNDNPPVRTTTPPVSRTTTAPNDRKIIHMQVPPTERQKIDRHRPQVEKNLLKKNPPPRVAPPPKKVEDKKGDDKR